MNTDATTHELANEIVQNIEDLVRHINTIKSLVSNDFDNIEGYSAGVKSISTEIMYLATELNAKATLNARLARR